MIRVFATFLFAVLSFGASGQSDSIPTSTFCRYPLVAGLEFQNFALPFHDMKSYFTHPGISIGTETNLNRKSSLMQQVSAAFVMNKEMGSAFYIYTQTAFRFRIYRPLHGEIKLGVGWQRDSHPSDAYEFKKGEWTKVNGGKSLLIIPAGITLSYKQNTNEKFVPFISYQVLPSLFYDDVLPVSFYNIIQAGVRIYFEASPQKK